MIFDVPHITTLQDNYTFEYNLSGYGPVNGIIIDWCIERIKDFPSKAPGLGFHMPEYGIQIDDMGGCDLYRLMTTQGPQGSLQMPMIFYINIKRKI